MEVRFTIKGQSSETTFTPVQDAAGDMFLYSVNSSEEMKFALKVNNVTKAFYLEDDSIFEEEEAVIDERLLGLSEEWMEASVNGFEPGATETVEEQKPGYSPDDIFVENKPFSLRQLVDLIESGDIQLDSSFQRNFVWDRTRQSRLIESILLGLPLPSIYLSQFDDGTLAVVDGLQRLTTIRRFIKDDFALSNLEYLDNCNGMKYSQLLEVLSALRVRRFGQTQIMCFVIDYRSPSKLKFDLFRRLNTGGKPLNNQEIRNCLSRYPLQKALKEMVSSESFLMATDRSVKDTRMDAQEAALRYMYFLDQYSEESPAGTYSGDIDSTLDDVVERMNAVSDFSRYVDSFSRSMDDAFSLFGDYTFRKVNPYNSSIRRSKVNKLLMTAICVLLTKYRESYKIAIERGVNLNPYHSELIAKDVRYFNSITWSTNSRANIEYVLKTLKTELFDKYLK